MDLRQKLKTISRYMLGIFGALVFGFLLSYVILFSGKSIIKFTNVSIASVSNTFHKITLKNTKAEAVSTSIVSPTPEIIKPYKISLGNISDAEFSAPKQGKQIRANLLTMKLSLYEDGILIDTLPIGATGEPGTLRETPGGDYKILLKEENHISSISNVRMPYSMHFFGKYFIHGWPYYENGKPVSSNFSGGCIRLSLEDSKRVYNWADTETRVSIFSKNDTIPQNLADSSYFVKNPKKVLNISAGAYLVGDLDTGEIILQKNQDKQYSIASVSKLMTGLVSMETLKLFENTNISNKALSTYGQNGGFKLGEVIKIEDLLYPLLIQSSNDSAEILAEQNGSANFINTMNEKASAIGLSNTTFRDPSGLSPYNASTPFDLFKLSSFIYKQKSVLLDITRTKTYKTKLHTWNSNNQFLNTEEYLGGKSGYTDLAKETVVALFKVQLSEFNTRNISIVILNSNNRFQDVNTILNYIKDNIYYGSSEPFVLDL